MNLVSERPGVYSSYDASAVVSAGGGGGAVGLAAQCGAGTAGQVYALSRYEVAVSQFGAGEEMTRLVRLLFLNGAAGVYAAPVGEEGYEAAFQALE